MRWSGTLPHHLFGNTPNPSSMFADFRVLPVLVQLWTHSEQSAVPLKLLFGQRALPTMIAKHFLNSLLAGREREIRIGSPSQLCDLVWSRFACSAEALQWLAVNSNKGLSQEVQKKVWWAKLIAAQAAPRDCIIRSHIICLHGKPPGLFHFFLAIFGHFGPWGTPWATNKLKPGTARAPKRCRGVLNWPKNWQNLGKMMGKWWKNDDNLIIHNNPSIRDF